MAVEAVELVFAVMLLIGLSLVAAMVVDDQAGAVTVLDGNGEVADPVAKEKVGTRCTFCGRPANAAGWR